MSWQEEEIAKRKQEAEAQSVKGEEDRTKSLKIMEFWSKLVTANEQLSPEIRCPVNEKEGTVTMEGSNYRSLSLIREFRQNYHTIGDGRGFSIEFDIAKGKYLGELSQSTMLKSKPPLIFKIDDRSIEILLKNLCTGKNVQVGLKAEVCLIATSVYGSYDAPPVLIFRQFRDQVLLRSRTGRLIVNGYYLFSPGIAVMISRRRWLRFIIRKCLLEPAALICRTILSLD
jgi:hypothetical protein